MIQIRFPRWSGGLTLMARLKRVSPQRAALAAVLAAIVSAALAVQVHGLWDLCDAFHQGAAQSFFGVAFLLKVRIIGKHLLPLVDLQLGIQLLQLILKQDISLLNHV